jgi:hypothetical protein
MKHYFLIYLFFLSFGFVGFTQTDDLKYGIKIGTNFSEYTPDFNVNNTSLQSEFSGKFGYYLGGFANFKIHDKIGLQGEILLSNNGTKVKYDVPVIQGTSNFLGFSEFEYNLNEFNLSIPITTQFYFSERFYGEAGLILNYTLFVNQNIINNPYQNSAEDYNENPEENIDRFDLAGLLGLGFKLSKKININLRYSLSVIERNSSAFHNDNIALPDIFPIDYIRSSILYLGLEYNINVFKKNKN